MATQELILPLTRVQYVGDGDQTQFSVPFQFVDPEDIEVYLDETRCSMGFQVQPGGTASGGVVNFTDPPELGTLVTLIRRTSSKPGTKFQESGTLRAQTLNAAFEQLAAVDQDAQRETVRTIRLHPTDDDADLILPRKELRRGKSLGFDAEGNITTVANAGSSAGEYHTLDGIDAGTTNVHFTVSSEQKLASIQPGAEPNPALVTEVEKNDATETSPRTFSPKDVADMASRHGGGTSGNFEPAFEKNAAFNKDFGTTEGTVCEGNDDRLTNKRAPLPHSHPAAEVSGLAAVARSGAYEDLVNPPVIPATTDALKNTSEVAGVTASDAINTAATIGQSGDAHAAVQSGNPHNTTCTDIGAEPAIAKKTAFNKDFGTTAGTVAEGNHTHLIAEISGVAAVATTGSYNDLANLPTIPERSTEILNDSNVDSGAGTVTSALNTLLSSLSTTVDIKGGAIDGTVIGATAAAAGTFTSLNADSIGGVAVGDYLTAGDIGTTVLAPDGSAANLTNVPFPTVVQSVDLNSVPEPNSIRIILPDSAGGDMNLPSLAEMAGKVVRIINRRGHPVTLKDPNAGTGVFLDFDTELSSDDFTLPDGGDRTIYGQTTRYNVFPSGDGSGTEVNDLTAAVTWADVPDANITQSSVKQHEAALSIDAAQITTTTALSSLTFPERITFKDETTSAGAEADRDLDPFSGAGNYILPRRVRRFNDVVSMDLHVGEVRGTDTNKAVKIIDVNNANATVAGPFNLGPTLQAFNAEGIDPSAYIASIDPETTVDLALVSAGTGNAGTNIVVTAAELVLWRRLAASGAVLGTVSRVGGGASPPPPPSGLPELPVFPALSYDGFTATSTGQSLPVYDSTNHKADDYQALYANRLDFSHLTDSGTDLVMTVDLSTFVRPASPISVSAATNAALYGSFLEPISSGTTPGWASWVSQEAKDALISIIGGHATKGHAAFTTTYAPTAEAMADKLAFYLNETGVDWSEVFWSPLPAGGYAGSDSAQANLVTNMIAHVRGQGHPLTSIEPMSEPFPHSSAWQTAMQKEVAIAVKNWFAANAPGVDYQVSAAASRATVASAPEGAEANGLFLADTLRPYCNNVSVHAYVFGTAVRGDYTPDHNANWDTNIRNWAVGQVYGMTNRLDTFARLLRNEFNRPSDDGITRYLRLGEWSAPKQEYADDLTATGGLGLRDECYTFRGMLGVMYKTLFYIEAAKIPNMRSMTTWADAAGNRAWGLGNGNGQLVPVNQNVNTTAHYWGMTKLQQHWGVAQPATSGTVPFAAAGVADNYTFGPGVGPDSLGPFPLLVERTAVNATQDRLYIVVANTDTNTTRNVSYTLSGRTFPTPPSIVSATKISAIDDIAKDTWLGQRMAEGLLTTSGTEINGAGEFVSDFASSVSINGNVVTWSQEPFSIVYVEIAIPLPA